MQTLPCSRQRGTSLLEVLVTVVVLAFGLVGVAGLLIKGASYANTSYARTAVTQRIYSLADRMRANPKGVEDGNYNAMPASPCPAPQDCGTSSCDAAKMAAFDLCQWRTEVNALHNGTGTVQRIAGTNVFTVGVTWDSPGSGTQMSYSLNVQP